MTLYRERLWAAPWMYLATALIIPATLLVSIPINLFIGIIVAIVLYGVCVALLIGNSPRIEVTESHLYAGTAHIERALIGPVEGFRKEEASLQRGQKLDARAWLMIRGWIDPVVRVTIEDSQDPTPYWLLSTRHPEKLVRVLTLHETPEREV